MSPPPVKTRNIKDYCLRHKGKSVCLLGNGPTLSQWSLDELRAAGYHLFGMNKSWTHGPAYYHTFLSSAHLEDVARQRYCPGRWQGDDFKPGVLFTTYGIVSHRIRVFDGWPGTLVIMTQAGKVGDQVWFSADMAMGYHSCFAGSMALELAMWMGYDEIYLLGYDTHNYEGHHWDGDSKPAAAERTTQIAYMRPVSEYATKTRSKVFNANPDSAITWFPFRSPLEKVKVA